MLLSQFFLLRYPLIKLSSLLLELSDAGLYFRCEFCYSLVNCWCSRNLTVLSGCFVPHRLISDCKKVRRTVPNESCNGSQLCIFELVILRRFLVKFWIQNTRVGLFWLQYNVTVFVLRLFVEEVSEKDFTNATLLVLGLNYFLV